MNTDTKSQPRAVNDVSKQECGLQGGDSPDLWLEKWRGEGPFDKHFET